MSLEDAKLCDSCEVLHDVADLYPVDGQELCEGCMKVQGAIEALRTLTGVDVDAIADKDAYTCKVFIMHLAARVGWTVHHRADGKLKPVTPQ